ncbi:MAG: N-formylglutamate amidohydrolase [Pelagibacterales bacterium]|nr:N-formylglutamate amidohydrolase [Pelagibacterales bacterium]
MIESNLNSLYPIIISIPHSGNEYSENFLSSTQLNKNELEYSEDSYVDLLLIKIIKSNFSYVKANFPRSYVDVNRHPFEIDPLMVSRRIPNFINSYTSKTQSGIGVIPRVSVYGNDIYNHLLTRKEIIRRLLYYYFPYHKKLKYLIKYLKNKFKTILILDFHSMPSISTEKNIDIVLGNNNNLSCDNKIISLIKHHFSLYDYSIIENNPYSGGFITKSLGQPDTGIHVVQIEISRSLYMNEQSLEKNISKMNLLSNNLNIIINNINTDIKNIN